MKPYLRKSYLSVRPASCLFQKNSRSRKKTHSPFFQTPEMHCLQMWIFEKNYPPKNQMSWDCRLVRDCSHHRPHLSWGWRNFQKMHLIVFGWNCRTHWKNLGWKYCLKMAVQLNSTKKKQPFPICCLIPLTLPTYNRFHLYTVYSA